jgi:hypothetical protein
MIPAPPYDVERFSHIYETNAGYPPFAICSVHSMQASYSIVLSCSKPKQLAKQQTALVYLP